MEEVLFPIMDRYLSQDGESIFEEVVQMLSYFTFLSPQLSPRLWSLWPKLHEAVTTWAIDYFDEVLVCLDNYISRGTDVFLGNAYPNYLQSANQVCVGEGGGWGVCVGVYSLWVHRWCRYMCMVYIWCRYGIHIITYGVRTVYMVYI